MDRAVIPSSRLQGTGMASGDKRLAGFLCTPPHQPLVRVFKWIFVPASTAEKDSLTSAMCPLTTGTLSV
jgi:hypothetical protein